jgi:predicted RNA-binding protein with TRAM domain
VFVVAYPVYGPHMEISDQLRCLFSATVEQQDDSYLIEVPGQEIQIGDVRPGETYRVAILPADSGGDPEGTEAAPESAREPPAPPVEEGDQRDVEIEDIGEQGDGITRVERGFVVIVPDTEQGERVSIEITDVRENVAFAEVTERLSYFD